MSRYLLALASLLVLAQGCRHANTVPTLPASHGYLSLAFDVYPSPLPDGALVPIVGGRSVDIRPQVVVEPAQAPAVFAEAVQVLEGKPTAAEVEQAAQDLSAACAAEWMEACDFLREKFKRPRRLEFKLPDYPPEALKKRALAYTVLQCQLPVTGRFRDCEVIEAVPREFGESALRSAATANYAPARLAGHPIEVSYTLNIRAAFNRDLLTPQVELRWALERTKSFPDSPHAWATLAGQLARYHPEAPGYPATLERLHVLVPRFWWSANELAWLHVQQGRFTEAAPLAKEARAEASRSPYVLETHAAVLAATGQCEKALAEQRRAVERLPQDWPALERERFQAALRVYTQKCAQPAPAPAPAPAS